MKRKIVFEDCIFTSNKRPKVDCKISDLPNEMLREIFKNLPTKDRLTARRVSNFWMELLNKYFQDDNTLKLSGHAEFSPTGSLYQTFKARLSSTKTKRVFSRLLISWLPDEEEFDDFINFIKLIGDEVRFLNIFIYTSISSSNDLYANLPNLESLEVCDEQYLGDFTFPPKLKSIKIEDKFSKLEKLPDIQKLPSLEHFSAKSIVLKRNTDALASFLDPKLKTLLDAIIGSDDLEKESVKVWSEFNFCGEAKLIADDITEIEIDKKMLDIAPLAEFNNLKRLELYSKFPHSIMHFTTFHKSTKFPSVIDLEIYGPDKKLTNFDELLSKFPNVESLNVDEWKLTDLDFRVICQYMPKLKNLTFETSTISIKTLFDCNNFSVKDLKSLESLSVQTIFENRYVLQPSWPSLPDLKVVQLKGEGFRYLEKDFYTQMAVRSPNIEDLEIYYYYGTTEINHTKFLPVLSGLTLKKLTLPGEGGTAKLAHNNSLVDDVIKYCKDLTYFALHDVNGFSLAQEIRLFKSLSKLETVFSNSMNTEAMMREMNRSEFKNLKNYLAESIDEYKDLPGTIAYLYNNVIPLLERIRMENNFKAEFWEDHLKTWYIVLHDYLKMSFINVVRILKLSHDN
ncbi:uncharacterized protein LOC134829978 [Culicoides brevitarsis]|uniref:uncharacterized protein LOC134829978 n=1 Tax=Culicoides brevitarsis TaxID=469753 RepID=UPI00307BC567